MSLTFINAITNHMKALESAPDSALVISGKTERGETLYKTVSKMVGILYEILFVISNGKCGCNKELVDVSLGEDANRHGFDLTSDLFEFLKNKRSVPMNVVEVVEITDNSSNVL